MTHVQLSYEKQTHVYKIYCLDFPSMQFVHDFAIIGNNIYLLQKKPIEDSDPPQFDYNLIVLSEKTRPSEKSSKRATSQLKLPPIDKNTPIKETAKQNWYEMDPTESVCYKEYVKRKEYTYDLTAAGLVPEGSMPFQDCGYSYTDSEGVRQVHEGIVLLVRDTKKPRNSEIQFVEIVHNLVDKCTELRNINPT